MPIDRIETEGIREAMFGIDAATPSLDVEKTSSGDSGAGPPPEPGLDATGPAGFQYTCPERRYL